jgi:hypothetical protein
MNNSTLILGVLVGCAASGGTTPPPVTRPIAGIAVTGQPVMVFDHTRDQQEPNNIPDGQVTAWREVDGTVNLLIPAFENFRMRGPDVTHVTIDPPRDLQLAGERAADSRRPRQLQPLAAGTILARRPHVLLAGAQRVVRLSVTERLRPQGSERLVGAAE